MKSFVSLKGNSQMDFYAVDLFAGAGGLALGLEEAGFSVVLANELEKDFAHSYRLNHPKTKMLQGDIHDFDFAKEVGTLGLSGKISLVFGGPPCQGFSTIGKKDENDDRNSLFWQFLRAVEEIGPEFVLFENVSGFKRMYGGRMHATLLGELNRLGYNTKEDILNAVDFGLPQYRERTIIVGFKEKYSFVFPQPEKKQYLTLWDAISDLPQIESGEKADNYDYHPRNEYQKRMRTKNSSLTEHTAPTHGEKLLKVISLVPEGGSIMDVPEELRPKSYFANTYARLLPDRPAPTITRNFGTPSSSRCIHPFLNRGLTTREGARLQGFPDNYQFVGSRSAKNLQIGNAVPPLLGKALGKQILRSLCNANTKEEHASRCDICTRIQTTIRL